jgi:hypothetical protein
LSPHINRLKLANGIAVHADDQVKQTVDRELPRHDCVRDQSTRKGMSSLTMAMRMRQLPASPPVD